MTREKACRTCRKIVEEGNECPNCKGKTFTTFWKGYLVVIDPEKSEVAAKVGVTKPGKYALRLGR